MGLIQKIFGTYSQRELKSIYPIADKIEALEEEYRALTDEQLQAKTPEFKQRLQQGETLDDILPEAFAAVREAADREMGFDYLRDNMAIYKNEQVQRGHSFAIVDEVDSILIDEARTPLIISGMGEKSTQLYDMAESFACRLKK